MKLKSILAAAIVLLAMIGASAQPTDTQSVTISGIVTDFGGNAVPDALVRLQDRKFAVLYEAKTDKDGAYSMTVKKGVYQSMCAMKWDEYPSADQKKPQRDQRLEAWAWNIPADEDLVINLRYDRLEVYGLTAFKVRGAAPGIFVYCRPMSLTRVFSLLRDGSGKLCPEIRNMEIEVEINGQRSEIHTIEMVDEYINKDSRLNGYLLHVSTPADYDANDANVFRVKIRDLENDDVGEAVYFSSPERFE